MLSKRHLRHLDRALAIAEASTCKTRHGAVIAHNGRVVAVGVNASRNHPSVCSDPKTQAAVHAEIAAIRALPRDTDWSRLTLYSARVDRKEAPANAKPCPRCAAVIDFLGFKDVYWT